MTQRQLPPLRRDLFFLLLGGAWGTWIVFTAGPWPLMAVSAATMLGPGFLRLWLSGPAIGASPPSQPLEPAGPSSSSSPMPLPAGPGGTE